MGPDFLGIKDARFTRETIQERLGLRAREEADMAFIDALKSTVLDKSCIREVDAHINDDEFVNKVVEVFDEIVKRK